MLKETEKLEKCNLKYREHQSELSDKIKQAQDALLDLQGKNTKQEAEINELKHTVEEPQKECFRLGSQKWFIYQPNTQIQEVLKKERVKLTPARAMLLDVLFDLVKSGDFVSEFAAEKIAYFLQRFGAKKYLNLEFQPNFYGPYSGKVKHVLYYLNCSYIIGYSSKDRKPFEELGLILDAEKDVETYLNLPENAECKEIVESTKPFMTGFYSAFSMELLSTIDFIRMENDARSMEEISRCVEAWSDRKKTKFSNPRFIKIAVAHLEKYLN